ncbi:hypothetical protein Dimus_034084 [Dionaea muscipula]
MRKPCCEKEGINKGAWSKQEDQKLIDYIKAHGEGCWRSLPQAAGLHRCGKSCRLRWINYLRPDIKRGNFAQDEEDLIIKLHALLGNRWSLIAGRLPGRTDNEVKNYWNSHIRKKLLRIGIDPNNHKPHQHLPQTTVPVDTTTTTTSTSSSRSLHDNDNNNNNSNNDNDDANDPMRSEPLMVSKSSSRPNDIVVDGGCGDDHHTAVSCRVDDGTTTTTTCALPDLNLDLTIAMPKRSVIAIFETKNDSKITNSIMGNEVGADDPSPTLLLFR